MVVVKEVYVKDLYKKHESKELKGFYSIGKKTDQDDGEVVNEGFVLDTRRLWKP
ncbi:MAG TPA: hypothetical protein VD815_08305 [Candidatus Saccharimonadales bacterium]|nr:hypothetical protein [Candidatus Saccharimonadales bacterium]